MTVREREMEIDRKRDRWSGKLRHRFRKTDRCKERHRDREREIGKLRHRYIKR